MGAEMEWMQRGARAKVHQAEGQTGNISPNGSGKSTLIKILSDGSISASKMLERFLFPASMQDKVVDKLLGGEIGLSLLFLMEAPNVLLLDVKWSNKELHTRINKKLVWR